jgi:hypothetical protein
MCLSQNENHPLFGNNTTFGKINKYTDPLGAAIATGDKSKLDPGNFFKKPNIPDPPAPVAPPQAATNPDTTPLKRRNDSSFASGGETLLTGPSGISRAQLNLGGASLLGN